MARSLTLKFVSVLLIMNAGLQCWQLWYSPHHLVKLQQAQREDRVRWNEWERVGKARTAAGSKTEFVPDPFYSEDIRKNLVYIKLSIALATLVATTSLSAAWGLLMGRRWAYSLALTYASQV